jgi:phosphonate transport system permease protein
MTASTPSSGSLAALLEREDRFTARTRPSIESRRRRAWIWAVAVAIAWCAWDAGVLRRQVLNLQGWQQTASFFGAAASPELSSAFLRETASNALITIAYAVLGTILAVLFGVVGGLALSEVVWRRRVAAGTPSSGGARIRTRRRSSLIVRGALAIPRGIHEAVWGLILLNILGNDPLVAVLALAIPFGAITAKVFAELIDESGRGPNTLLRASGAGRVSALVYGVLPTTGRDLLSYAFYRFECSLRSAVILGMIGAGGLGFQLQQSSDGGVNSQVWTAIYALVILGLIVEHWAALLRRTSSRGVVRASIMIIVGLIVASWWKLGLRPWNLWSPRARTLAAQIGRDAWPPKLPSDGWPELARAARETLQMSFLAIVFAVVLGIPLSLCAVRMQVGGRSSFGGALVRFMARVGAVVARSVPPTVWALIVLFLVLPGAIPGALALGIYTAGVLARLFCDVIENADARPKHHLRALGANQSMSFLYGTVPEVAPKWAAYSLYRWEVVAREAVVVGMVGAGGLGTLLSAQKTSFNFAAMLTTVIAIIAVTIVVDTIGSFARRALR